MEDEDKGPEDTEERTEKSLSRVRGVLKIIDYRKRGRG